MVAVIERVSADFHIELKILWHWSILLTKKYKKPSQEHLFIITYNKAYGMINNKWIIKDIPRCNKTIARISKQEIRTLVINQQVSNCQWISQ